MLHVKKKKNNSINEKNTFVYTQKKNYKTQVQISGGTGKYPNSDIWILVQESEEKWIDGRLKVFFMFCHIIMIFFQSSTHDLICNTYRSTDFVKSSNTYAEKR